MHLPEESEPSFHINILPMIDVIFSILAFFIISTLYLTRSEGLNVNLPKATTAQTQLQAQLTVSIQANGAIFLNRQPISLAELGGAVRSQIGANSESLVIINADEYVPHGRVVSVMDRLRQIEGIKLAIAAEKESF